MLMKIFIYQKWLLGNKYKKGVNMLELKNISKDRLYLSIIQLN